MPGWTTAFRAALRRVRPHETKARFVGAGALNTVFGLTIFPILMWTLGPRGLHYMAALVIAQFVSVIFAYFTQKFLVFRTKGNYFRELRRFSMFYIYNFAFNLVTLPIMVEGLHIRPIFAQFFLSIIVIITSYFWHSRITFKPPEISS